jgi:Meiotically up-regulated gene 113
VKKQHIIDEIKRTAAENGGKALGRERFGKVTGIREGDWSGRYWARWSEAVREAGLAPNQMNALIDESVVLGQYVELTRKLGRLPVTPEMRMHKRQNPACPNEKVFERFGSKDELIRKVFAYCLASPGNDDVAAICSPLVSDATPEPANAEDEFETGFVYLALMRVGREKRYKFGKANIVEQRARQIGPHLPEDLEQIHTISTDDAYGIEAYWHKRFAEKRRGGEWFELNAEDVRVPACVAECVVGDYIAGG